MPKKPVEQTDLKEDCVRAAHQFIAENGVEALSLREVARRLGVSHQAPYKHYPNRDYLLSEVMRRCFKDFADFLDARELHEAPEEDLASLGRQYLTYAANHALEYRLMFGTPWPDVAEEVGLVRDAVHSFDVLRSVLRRTYSNRPDETAVDLDAMFIWSSLHGLASITQSNVMGHLNLSAKAIFAVPEHIRSRIRSALQQQQTTQRSK